MSESIGALLVRHPQGIDLTVLIDVLRRFVPPAEISTRRWTAMLTAECGRDLLMIQLFRRGRSGEAAGSDIALEEAGSSADRLAASLAQPVWELYAWDDLVIRALDERGELRWKTDVYEDGGPRLGEELGVDLDWLLYELPYLPALSIPLAAESIDSDLLCAYLETGRSMRVAAPRPPPRARAVPKATARRACVEQYVWPVAHAIFHSVREAKSVVFAVGPYFPGYEALPSCPSPRFAQPGAIVPWFVASREEDGGWPMSALWEHNGLAHEDEAVLAESGLVLQRRALRIAHKGLSLRREHAPKWVVRADAFAAFMPWLSDDRVSALPAGAGPLIAFRPYQVARASSIRPLGPD